MKFFLRFASLLLLQFCFIYPVLLAQTPDSWTQKANFGGLGRLNAVGFNIGNKGYIGTGANATTAFSDIWEYDPSTDTWAQKADYGGGARRGAYAFVVGNKAYVGGGSNSAADEYPATASLWEYNSFANTWTQKASSGPLFYGSVAFSIDGKGYVITGGIASYSADNINFALTRRSSGNVAMYDPETDTWTNKARGPFDLAGAFGFTINGKGYVGGGTDNGGVIKKGFYEYNPSTDTWTAKADFAGDRAFGSPSFVSGNRGFVGLTGLVGAAQNLYEYNPASDTWTSRAVYPDGGTVGGAAFSIGNKGYIGTGSSKKTFYEYTSAETFTPATALKFDPSEDAGDNSRLNYVSVDNPFRGFQKEITVEFWMYAPSANMPFGSIMGQGSNNVDANWVWLMHPETNGTMTFYVSDGASFKTAKCNIIAGSWHHYAATSSAGSTKFYVDGNEVSFYTINGQQFNDAVGGGLSSGLLSNTNAVLHIGKDVRYETRNIGNNDPKNRYAVMTIDELRIWSRALCVDEIRHNKNVEINPAVQTGLQHYYSFNQGFVNANNPGETILRDLSGNNRNGELKNFSLYGTNSNWVASGFTSTGIYTLYDNSAAPITGVNNICMGTNTTLLNTRSGGKWLSSNTSVATINEITGLVTPISPGSTTITYTTNCNVSTLNFTVNALTTPTISGTGTIFLCSGSSTTLTASGGATYSWSPGGATTASVTVSPTVNTTYTVTATTAAGCSATTSRNVGIVNKPMVSAISNSPVSSGNTLQLDASGANTYSWSGPNGFTSSVQNPVINNVTAAATGTYTVTGANSFGCTNTATVNVTVSSLPATALKTDGVDDHITISNPFKSFEKEITVEFWMNTPTGKLAQGSIMGLSSLNVDGMDTDVWLMHPDLGGTNLDFYVNDAGTWRRATVPIIAGGWHHYVGVASEFGIKFYVDGVLKKTEAGINTGILRNANAIMQIGKDPRHTNFRFADMTIDEVRIWSRALCEAEIINNKNCELNPVGQDGLQQYYRFNQGYVSANNSTETSLTDLSGNNRHGVLSGFALNGVNSNWVASGSTNTGTCTSFSTPTAPITGTTTICGIGNTSTLSNAIAGGLWSSSNTSVATINANTGLVTALSEGNTTITYKNECGGISTILVRVVSTASPTITGPAGGTNACPGNTVTLTAPIAFANYQWFRDGVAVTFTTSTRTYNATVSGTYTATRISFGCTSALSNAITVTIADAIKPTITCPANQTLNLDASCKATLPDYRNLVTVSDNCTPTGSLVITQSPAAGSEVNDKGSMIVTLTVRDAAGNESTCTITIEKKDVTGPVVTCPAPIAVNAPTNTCGAVVTFTSPNATDNCGIIPFTSFRGGEPNQFQGALQDYLQLYTDGTWDDLQNTTLNKWIVEFNTIITTSFPGYTRIGEFGGHSYYVSTSTATWINARLSAQSIGGDLVSINTQAENSLVAPYGMAWVGGYQDLSDSKYIEPGNASQNYGGWKWVDGTSMSTPKITITQTAGLPSGSVFPLGVTTNTFIARDESGNESTCSFTVTVRDVQPPVISCPANINVTATSAAGAVVNYTTPVGTDNCSGATTERIAGPASGSTFPIGTTTVTHRVTDAAGLSTECSFTVTVSGLAPVIVSPGNQTVNVAPGTCAAVVNFAATETTGIPASTITYSIPSGSTFGLGSTVVTATATNAVGTSSVQFTITVRDAQPPVITCPADITVTATSAAGAVVNYVAPVGTDNCPGTTTTRIAGLASGSVFPQGTTTVTYRATDAAGNITNCSFNVTVNAPTVAASALNFDGVNDFVAVSNPFRAFQKEITVEFWMNTPNTIMPYGSIMGQSTSGVDNMSTNVWLMHPDTKGNIDFLVNDGGVWKGVTVALQTGWHHYVGVASEFGVRFYVDGVLAPTVSGGPGLATGITNDIVNNPNSVLHIGKDVRHNTGRFGNITIDEVRIWSRVLCQEEIQNNMNCELNPQGQTGLEEYYRFNQGFVDYDNTGETSLIDLSGKGRNGQLNNLSLTGNSSNWTVSGSTNNGTCSSYIPPTAPITGTTSVCIGASSTLSNTIGGGLWSSSNTNVATVNATTGVVVSRNPGTTVITYRTECGSVITTNFTVKALPVITISANGNTSVCPGNTVMLEASSIADAIYQWKRNGVDISGANNHVYQAPTTGSYSATVTVDGCTSAVSNAITVTVADAIKPTITCPANQTLNLDATCKATLPDYRSLLIVSDNCTATGSLVITQSPAAGSVVNGNGSMVVDFTVIDATGNESTCTITIEKKDVTAPVVTCPAPIVVNATTNTCGAVVTFTSPNATDNCGIIPFTSFRGGEPNQFQGALQDYLQLYTDGTWDDLQNTTLNKWIVEFNTIITTSFPGYTRIGEFGGHTYYVSTSTATWINARLSAQSIGGDLVSINTQAENSFVASSGIAWVGGYQDLSDSKYIEPGNDSQNYGGWKWVDGTSMSTPKITITQTAGLPSGSVFPVGVTTNTFVARDESGNESTCSFTVTVRDVQPPVIHCPANISVTATSAGGAVVNYTTPVGTDNCSGATTVRTAGLASGSTFPIGTTTVTYRVTDAAGLSTQCSFTVTVVGVAPVISCPANITVNAAVGTCAANVNFAATETVGIPASSITYTIDGNPVASGASFPVGTTTVVATATNAVGSSSCSFTVTVVDNQNPTITAPADVQGNNTAGLCTGTVTLGAPATGDNCGVASVTNDAPTTGIFPIGSTTVIWTVTDIHGNKTTATQTVVIVDNEKPTISVTDVNVNNDEGKCGASVVIAQPETDDNCGVATISGVRSDNQLLTADYPVGTTTITWTVRDVNGNHTTTTQTIVVADNEKPTISVTNVNVNNDAGKCGASVMIAQPSTADNCDIASVVGVRSDHASLSAEYPVGTTTITWKVTDIHGNDATTTQTVVVNDTELPVVKTNNIVVQLGANGQASITTSQINNGSTDNCTIASIVLDKMNFNCSNVGENTVLLTVTDIHGNIASANATVTVQDNILPTVVTQPVTVTLVNGAASVTAAQINNGSFDNCGIATMTVSPANFNCNNIGSNTVILTVTDVNGNTNTASATVTVVGQLPSCSITSVPTSNVFTGGNPNNIYLGYGAQSTVLNVAATGGSSYTYQWSGTATQMLSSTTAAAPVFTPTAPGNYTFTVTVTNNFGCTSTCTITICVKDIRVPGTGLKGSPAKVYICHLPPGNKSNPQTLEISVNAVATHIGKHDGDRLGTCAMTPCAEPAPTTVSNALISKAVVEGESKASTNEELKVTVMPNPSATYFTLKLESKYDAPVNMKVVDVLGRVVDNRVKLGSNATVEVGHNYQSGTYFAEFIQGNRRKVVQLLKIKR